MLVRKPALFPFFYSLFILLLSSSFLIGQEYELVKEAQFRELPNLENRGTVRDIQIDRDGFLWFISQGGIQRYDGTGSKVFEYNPNKLDGLAGNWITAMTQDSSGQFWIGVFGLGLQRFDPVTEQFTLIKPILLDQ
jgi:ligand-binding sensor domain-containing protein